MTLQAVTLLILALSTVHTAAAQRDASAQGFELAVRGVLSKAEEESEPRGGWSNPGFEVGVAYRLGQGVALELRGSYRKWNRRRFFVYVPLYLGLRYDVRLHDRLYASPFVSIGSAGWLINDAGGLFAAYDAGLRLSARVREHVSFTLGASYSRVAVFHPSEFGYVDVQGGVRLSL